MRIDAIRGQNLASLSASFAIDLAEVPLRDAGTFLISGPTGAGKSSLLDVLCLALYNRVPRLPEQTRTRGGKANDEEVLSTSDVRSLLRSDAGEGYAEADFVGIDGVRYRARWQVHRARRRAGARLQPHTMSLIAIETGRRIGDKNQEVLEEIEARIGFDFQHFQRAVLLPQGRFAAFLHADANERATLLERLTGTEIYSRIGARAFERFRERQREVALLREQRGEHSPMSSEDRQTLEAQIAESTAALNRLEEQGAQLTSALSWFERDDVLSRTLEQMEKRYEREKDASIAASPDRERLARYEAVADLHNDFDDLLRRSKELDARKEELGALERRLQDAEARLKEAEQCCARATTEEQRLAASFEALQIELNEAKELDQGIEATERRRVELLDSIDRAKAKLASIKDKSRALHDEGRTLSEAIEGRRSWLEQHAAADLESLARSWAVTDDRFARLSQAQLASAAAHREALEGKTREREASKAASAAEKAASQTLEQAEKRKQTADEGRRALERLGEMDRHAELDRARARLEALAAAIVRANELAELGRIIDAAQKNRAKLQGELDEGRRVLEQDLAPSIDALQRERKEVARHLENARAALSFAEQRGLLREGDPCPLCGSLDHPWSKEAPSREEGVLGKALEALDEGLAQKLAGREYVVAQQAKLEGRLEDLDQRLSDDRQRLEKLERDSQGADEPAALAREREALEQERDRLLADQRAYDEASKALRSAEEAEREGERQAEKASAELQIRSSRLERCIAEARRLEEHAKQTTRDVEHLIDAIASSCVAAQEDRLRDDPEAERQRLGALVEAFRLAEEEIDGALAGRARIEAALASQKGERKEIAATLRDRAPALRETELSLRALHARRGAVLAGRPVGQVESEARGAVRASAEAAAKARATRAKEEAACSEMRGRRHSFEEESARLIERDEQARSAFDDTLEQRTLALDDLRERLALRDEAPALRERLQRLDENLRQAETTQSLRRTDLEEHRLAQPAQARQDVEQARTTLAQEFDARKQLQLEALTRQRRDDERRGETTAIDEKLRAAEYELNIAGKLRELVGSRDGQEFRRFAQAITLEHLAAHANRHLRALTGRYEIRSTLDASLSLQIVDRDMADQRRSVHSLSGGETFLVSLALSLGLAGLHSQTQARSLFIDEGFGALDPESLEVALSALDALQASGRQVGLISHVEALRGRFAAEVRVIPQGGGRSRVHTTRQDA